MQTPNYSKAALGTLLQVAAIIAGWEIYWRSQEYTISYDDDEALWAFHRKKIYLTTPEAPVLVGSCRIKFGVGLDTWAKIAGKKPVQLALVGTSPRPVLGDLPLQHPTHYQLTLNKMAAEKIGITFPQELLAQAKNVLP